MAKKALAFIEVEGVREITRYTQIRIDQHLFGHHEFRIQVPIESIEGEGNFVFSKSKEFIGKVVRISLESDLLTDARSPAFVGIITDIGFARAFGSSNELILKGKSTTVLLDNGRNYRSFAEKGLSDIVKEVMKEYPANVLSCKADPEHTDPIPYVVQYKESNFNFLQRIANRYGEWIYYNGSELVFGKLDLPKAIPLLLGRDLYDFNLKLSLAATNYEQKYYNYEKSEVYTSASKDKKISHFDPAYGELAFNESGKLFAATPAWPQANLTGDQKELDKQVERRVDQQSSGMVFITGNSDHIGLGIGRTISVTGAKAEDMTKGLENFGEFVVTQATHYIGGDGDYYNSFSALPKEVGVPPLNEKIRFPQPEPEPAVVKENIDPKKLGRVRVQFYWQKGNEMTPWIRLVSSHGGKSGGFYVIPEKGDEVMAGYEHNHPDKPFVLGSVYNKDGKPAGNWSEPENNIKAIKTKCGNEIILNDKGGSEEIKILNKGGTNSIILTMSDGGAISITTPNQMNLSAKNISISAEEDIVMDARNVMVNTGKNIELTATENITTSSDKATAIEAKEDLLVKSKTKAVAVIAKTDAAIIAQTGALAAQGNKAVGLVSETDAVSVGGKTNVDIVADVNVNVSSKTMTSVGSDGPVVVSGKIVQLN
ncbi:MAG: hypothetical protein J5I98_03325 [Phaeodactylibacter sp.]|nr:hypothetical protein [Phaeodactylibacter sp.]